MGSFFWRRVIQNMARRTVRDILQDIRDEARRRRERRADQELDRPRLGLGQNDGLHHSPGLDAEVPGRDANQGVSARQRQQPR